MRTTVIVPDSKISRLMDLAGATTKTEAINRAIDHFIACQARQKLLGLRGKLELRENWRVIREMEADES